MPNLEKTQDFGNHVRFDPPFHFVLLPIFSLTVLLQIARTFLHPSLWNGWLIIAALGALGAVFLIRIYSLRIQDRVIRLEERLRLTQLDRGALLGVRLSELTVSQLTALRFACDEEACALAQRALAENLSAKQIKQAVKTWRPDFTRV